MKSKKAQKIGIIIAIIFTIIGTTSYAANNTTKNTSKNATTNKKVGLESLKVAEFELTPAFETTTYEYTVKYIGEETSIPIEATPTEAYYDVKVTGNKDLKEGENLITILVTDQSEENIATYQLTVNKSLVDEEEVARLEKEAKKQELMVKIARGGAIGIVALLIIVGIIKAITNRKDDWEEEEAEEEEEEILDNEEMELPKALRKKEEHKNPKGKRYK